MAPGTNRHDYAGPNTTLRPLTDADVEALYYSSLEPRTADRWRFRGATTSPEQFRGALFGPGTLAQFMVTPKDSRGDGVGLAAAYASDQSAGHCYVAIQRADSHHPDPQTANLMFEGTIVFLTYLFDHFDFRKVYFEIPGFNLGLVQGWAGTILVEEGRLRDHYFYADRYWDQMIYALYRAPFEETIALFFQGSGEELSRGTDQKPDTSGHPDGLSAAS